MAWMQQKKTWNNEIVVWDNLIVKLLNSNYLLIKDKLDYALHSQKSHFQDRMEKFDQLSNYVNEIKHDPVLQSILYENIQQLYK